MKRNPVHIWTDDDTADGCLRQAAWHGGFAVALIRILEKHGHAGVRESFSPEAMTDSIFDFVRSGARWADAYLGLVDKAERGYQARYRDSIAAGTEQ